MYCQDSDPGFQESIPLPAVWVQLCKPRALVCGGDMGYGGLPGSTANLSICPELGPWDKDRLSHTPAALRKAGLTLPSLPFPPLSCLRSNRSNKDKKEKHTELQLPHTHTLSQTHPLHLSHTTHKARHHTHSQTDTWPDTHTQTHPITHTARPEPGPHLPDAQPLPPTPSRSTQSDIPA